MHLIRRPDWYLPDAQVTPEPIYLQRRKFLKLVGFGLATTVFDPARLWGAMGGFPAALNPSSDPPGCRLTKEAAILDYNNFIEFSFNKTGPKIAANKGWKTDPWTLEIGGSVAHPLKFDVNDLIRNMGGLEQRNYRHRCVEAWSMVVPWDGFPLRKLIEFVEPFPETRYVQFTSFLDSDAAPNQDDHRFPWPYLEGLTLDEARNELALLATGIYGKPIANQNGAPIRLVVPWKYGFKSIKSIVKIDFVEEQPSTFWNEVAPDEYGFYGNVNPEVDHPRWSQAKELVIGGGLFEGKKRTLKFNGYEAQVGYLYKNLDLRINF
jgi:methionine sulfoxide reductase catalytic subunit